MNKVPFSQMIEYRCRAIIFETLFDSHVLARIHAAEALSLSSNHHRDSKISGNKSTVESMHSELIQTSYAVLIVRRIAYDPTHPNRVPAARALYRAGEQKAIEVIFNAVESFDSDQKATALESLAKLEYQPAKETCQRELNSSDPMVSAYALACLVSIGDRSVYPHLMVALKSHNTVVRRAAAWSAVKIKGPAFVEILKTLRNDPDPYVSIFANGALAGAKNEEALSSLRTALSYPDQTIRYLAADYLGEAGDVNSVDQLISALHDTDSDVRLYAAFSLLKLAVRHPVSFNKKHMDLITEPQKG